jgi:type II secretory pathway component PulF
MPTFIYKAIDTTGKIHNGTINSENNLRVIEELKQKGLIPVEIKEKKDKLAWYKKKYSLVIISQLSNLLNAGVTIDKSLDILIRTTHNTRIKTILLRIKEDIQKGETLSSALSKYPKLFTALQIAMVRIGEISGNLNTMLARMSYLLQKQQELKTQFISIVIYPVLTIIIGALSVIITLTFVVPRLISIFQEMDEALPLPTTILIYISNIVVTYWWVFICFILIAILLYNLSIKTYYGRIITSWCKLHIPGVGHLVKMDITLGFTRALATLLNGGIPLIEAIKIIRDSSGNPIISSMMNKIEDKIRSGMSLSNSLQNIPVFPELMIQLVACGEETGELERMLNNTADIYETTLKTYTYRILSIIEPVLILLVAGIVAFIISAIILPMVKIGQIPEGF